MKICILGLKNSGKSTVFSALTGIDASNRHKDRFIYSSVKVPDNRIDFLSNIFKPQKTTYPEIQFIDYNNPEQEKCFTNEYIAKLKESDGILKIIRNFDNPMYPAFFNEVSFLKEMREIDDEFILHDILLVEKRIEKLKNAKYKLSNEEKREIALLEEIKTILDNGELLCRNELSNDIEKIAKNYGLLSFKKELIVINSSEDSLKENGLKICNSFIDNGRKAISLCAVNEKELNELDENSRIEFAKELCIDEFGLPKVIESFYSIMNLITFMTIGEDEVKGWEIKKGTPAIEAAGKIHSDIKRGFIKAQVVSFEEFEKYKSIKECSLKGVLRLEGKDYIVKDGDVIEFKFNV